MIFEKKYALIGVLLGAFACCAAAQTPCFKIHYRTGQEAFKRRAFDAALEAFAVAKACPDKPKKNDLEAWSARAERGHAERSAWRSARSADDLQAWAVFLERYPDGYYRAQAEEHLQRLRELTARPIVQNTANGIINWTLEFVEATGSADINRQKWPDEAQAIEAAARGAEAVAKADLLETIYTISIRRQTTMQAQASDEPELHSQLYSLAQGAKPGSPQVGPEAVSVTVRVPLFGPDGLAAVLLPSAEVPPLADTSDLEVPEWTLVLPPGAAPTFTLFAIFTDAHNALLLDGSTTPMPDHAPLARWYRAKPGAYFTGAHVFEAQLNSMGHLMVPDAALPVFKIWKQARETGAGALPVRVVVR